jgi:hypothetical protein
MGDIFLKFVCRSSGPGHEMSGPGASRLVDRVLPARRRPSGCRSLNSSNAVAWSYVYGVIDSTPEGVTFGGPRGYADRSASGRPPEISASVSTWPR